ncbi:shikimate dehydrogenase [Sediminibacter sp. Hel_I_10]|uniref:shikimate dehydrogenase family protein n=1 Tax=Sediminibacter sp. Hel_I_10 TaxID=1392490 RepID=UPI000479CBFC|nr:shikimate dehydrogenase [Sediminibacter sp. Hel_I_10]
MSRLGLLGKHIDYSFSRGYFTKKFTAENLPHTYENFDLDSISELPKLLENNPDIVGMSVTIPYKQQVMSFLDSLDETAKEIGAVNTITVSKKGVLTGFNTDYYGFKKSITPLLKPSHKKALILGTGGASKAVAYALKQMEIDFDYVSRTMRDGITYTYDLLSEEIIAQYQIIINCTPLGTFPKVELYPEIPYQGISKAHVLFDLIYNPEETQFLKFGKEQGATTCNGHDMLRFQAEKAWQIWNLES